MVNRRNGKFAFRSYHGTYLSAHPDGSVTLADHMECWEEWTKIDLGNGKFALRSCHGTYLSACPDGSLKCEGHQKCWEEFVAVDATGSRHGGNGNTANSLSVVGHWNKTWSPSSPPNGATIVIAFSGHSDPNTALQQSNVINSTGGVDKFISLGGGTHEGRMTSTFLNQITRAIRDGRFAGYDGIAYDVEEGEGSLAKQFRESFAAAKAANLKVLVTVSHSAPYGIPDASALMQSFLQDENIDFFSPQLYTTGNETSNNFGITNGFGWHHYRNARSKIVPSIVEASYYDGARNYFNNHGIALAGFIQWK